MGEMQEEQDETFASRYDPLWIFDVELYQNNPEIGDCAFFSRISFPIPNRRPHAP